MANTLDNVIGSTVYGPHDEKIGKVKQLYLNNENDLPTWASVSTGLFSSDSLVPLSGATHDGDNLRVKVDKDAVKNAPHLDADGAISVSQEQELLRHYGVDAKNSGWDTYGKHAATPDQHDATSGQRADATVGSAGSAGQHQAKDATANKTGADDALVRSEERLDVGTQREAAGTARLRKYVVTEKQSVTVPVSHEEVRVVREPITDPSKVESAGKLGEAEREVTLHADKVTVAKESVPVERVGLAVDNVEEKQTVTETVQKEKIDTDGIDTPRSDSAKH